MKAVASADLKGLGANDGPAAVYDWQPPSLFPKLLPWLMILLLLALRPNRDVRAWWIWAPLAAGFGLEAALRWASEVLPAGALDTFCQCALALVFGLAALWLMLPLLGARHRFVAFLGALLLLGPATALAFAAVQDWEEIDSQIFFGILVLCLVALALAAALTLAGRNCRRRYHPLRLCGWLIAWLAVLFLVGVAPFALIALTAFGPEVLPGFGGAWLGGVAAGFGLLLPFLVLSFANRFYRERLKRWLAVEPATAPPVLPAVPLTTDKHG